MTYFLKLFINLSISYSINSCKIYGNKASGPYPLRINRNKFLGQPTIITSKKYESITKEQAAEIDVEIELITEPLQKNTAVCAIITALSAKAQRFDIVVLLPSDHLM